MMRSHIQLAAPDKNATTGTGSRARAHDTVNPDAVGSAAQSGGGVDDGPPEGDWMAEHVMKPTNQGPVGLPSSGAESKGRGDAVESRRGKQ